MGGSAVERRRSSRRRSSKRSDVDQLRRSLSKALERRQQDVEALGARAAEAAGAAGATVVGMTLMISAFLVVYVAHAAMDVVNRFRRVSETQRLMENGAIFRSTSSAMLVDWNPFWSKNVTVEVPLEDLPKKAVFMSNHISFADPFVLSGAQRPIETKWVGKSDLWATPVIGECLNHAGDLPVEFVYDKKVGRWTTSNRAEMMERAAWFLDNDIALSIFPEGKISRDTNELLPFKPGFFKLAIEKQAPVVPCAMWGNQYAWPNGEKQGKPYMRPADIEVAIGTPIYPEGKSLEEFMDEVFFAIQDLRNALPNFDLDDELAWRTPQGEPISERRRSSKRSSTRSRRSEQ